MGKGTQCEVAVERSDYALTVFSIHCRKLTVEIYSKGEGVPRIEAIAHSPNFAESWAKNGLRIITAILSCAKLNLSLSVLLQQWQYDVIG